jgi:hypothetical protein
MEQSAPIYQHAPWNVLQAEAIMYLQIQGLLTPVMVVSYTPISVICPQTSFATAT